MKNVRNYASEQRQLGLATLPVLAACCGLAAAVGLSLWTVERNHARDLDRDRAQTALALNQAKAEIQDLTNRLNAIAEKTAAEPVPVPTPMRAPAAPGRTVAQLTNKKSARPIPGDPRLDRLQGQLTEVQKELVSTRDELAKNKEELDGRINSARDDLNGSIAKTHDDVVALQRRGEQNIYEFKLTKSKEMQRVGALRISLRSTNVKHRTYDLAMIVEDNPLNKKHVNLYEPVWITLSDRPQPVQLVVNRVAKDVIEGYVSEPKYKKSDLAGNSPRPTGPQQQLATRDSSETKN
jgi:hypothetical protein